MTSFDSSSLSASELDAVSGGIGLVSLGGASALPLRALSEPTYYVPQSYVPQTYAQPTYYVPSTSYGYDPLDAYALNGANYYVEPTSYYAPTYASSSNPIANVVGSLLGSALQPSRSSSYIEYEIY